MKSSKKQIVNISPSELSLWDGKHKIPWNDPPFSERILREHLSQDHDLASRRQQTIEEQIQWLKTHCLVGSEASILDLGCGPGLYSTLLADGGHRYFGIDFSPASIDYAGRKFGAPGRTFVLGDVTETEYGGPYDLAMMLYGEINVFPPAKTQRILSKAYASLVSGGILVLEVQRVETVQGVGESPDTRTEAEGGVFSDSPYVCLTENNWYEAEAVAQQVFTVRAENEADSMVYKSTTKAWAEAELKALLKEVGFTGVTVHDDWPNPGNAFMLLTAIKG